MSESPTVAIWITPEQAGLARRAVDVAGVQLGAVGMPSASRRGETTDQRRQIAAHFPDADITTDLRQLLTASSADAVLIFPTRDAGAHEVLDDHDLLETVMRRGLRIASLEPVPASLRNARRPLVSSGRETLRFLPRFDLMPGPASAAELREACGTPRSAHYTAHCRTEQGSLAARLVDAMSVIFMLLGEPELIDASLVSTRSQSGLHLAPPESLLELTGDLHAHLRFAGTRAASIAISDRAPRWRRSVTLLAENGCLRLGERGFDFIADSGESIDESQAATIADGADPGAVAEMIGAQLAQLLDPHAPPLAPLATEVMLSMAHAALLSARTGQPECPATIRRMG